MVSAAHFEWVSMPEFQQACHQHHQDGL
jgi:hypothetical protein